MAETLMTALQLGAFVMCAFVMWSGVRLIRFARIVRAGNPIRERVRLPDEAVPENLAPIENEIRGLGFIPQRRVSYKIANSPYPREVWSYHHPELHIEAEIMPMAARPPFILTFETVFTDGALLATWYPRGENIDAPGLMTRFAAYSIHDAYDHHLMTQLQWGEQHGDPVPVSDDDVVYFARSVANGARFTPDIHRNNIRRHIGQGIARIGLAALLAFFVVHLGRQMTSLVLIDLLNADYSILLLLIGIILLVGGSAYSNRGKKSVALDAAFAPKIDPTLHPLHRPERLI